MSAFGPQALQLASRIGDGFVTVEPNKEFVDQYRSDGGRGPSIGALKVCWDTDEDRAKKLAHSLWPTDGLPGQLNQELPMPAHFEQASSLVSETMVSESVPCGPDPERHVAAITEYVDADFDEIYVNQIGGDLPGFIHFWERELKRRPGV